VSPESSFPQCIGACLPRPRRVPRGRETPETPNGPPSLTGAARTGVREPRGAKQRGEHVSGPSPLFTKQPTFRGSADSRREKRGAPSWKELIAVRILAVASEAVPFAKTGGLADVVGALPRALAARGHDVRVVMPRYRHIDVKKERLRLVLPEVLVHFPVRLVRGRIFEGNLPNSSVPVYFVDSPDLFARPSLYGENGKDYADNPVRFAFFDMAVIWMLKGLAWAPDIIQCNDWHSAMAPVFLKTLGVLRTDPFFAPCRTLFTVHNLAYQGLCGPEALDAVGLPRPFFHAECMEFWGRLSYLKGGIAFSDWISTVSPRYAREILTREFGCGLEGFIAHRRDRLEGILNGVDYATWNPETDPLIPRNYRPDDLSGKAACKRALQRSLRWPIDGKIPIIGMISRLDPQKGVDLVLSALPGLERFGVRLVILGSGRPEDHQRLERAQRRYPKWLRVRMGFDEKIAHGIQAGADAFLMPSRYEPCGLSQMFGLKYGTVPIVRYTGGLADTVRHATPQAIREGTATGFSFSRCHVEDLVRAVAHAVAVYREAPDVWRQIQTCGMRRDFSWDRSAEAYERLFSRMLAG